MTSERGLEIDCKDLVELVTEYLEGALDDHLQIVIDEHLGLCAGCAEYVEQVRVTIRELGRVPPQSALDLPDDVRTQLLAAFRHGGPTRYH
ncbi:MAG TPA: zf-HC2 domain-containing protein [Jatrophihabitans sp.]|jgi:predicted anti-sigma-YlaC factor YlaD|nr:zf-HC2 domain-containing protein [Jatrophihabitans sp.]